MKYLFLLFISLQAFAQSTREQQLNFRTQGANAALKTAAYASKGLYEPTQSTEAYILANAKNIAELKAFLRADLPEATQCQIISLIAKQDESILLAKYPNSKPQVSAFILKQLLAKPRTNISLKSWDAVHQKAFIIAVGTYKASWALPFIQNSNFKTEQIIAQLQVQGAKGLPAVWDLLKTNQVDAQKIADLSTTLAANVFLTEKLKAYDQASTAQKTVFLTYGSGRRWPEVKTLVWRAVQSNHPERAAGFAALTSWVELKDFDLIAEKLSIAQLPNEVKALQNCMAQLVKLDGTRNSKITAFALSAPQIINWVPFVQEVANLDWLYALGKKNEEALSAFVRINGKAFSNVDQQVLRYRNALDLTQNLETREQIYKGLAKCNSLSAMRTLYLGLKEPNIKQIAVDGLAALYVANPDFQGQMTKEWVLENQWQIADASIRDQVMKSNPGRGFYTMYNGIDLRGWKGLVDNPVKRRKTSADTLAMKQIKADSIMRKGWLAQGEELHFTGHGDNLCSVKDYQDFEMFVDWKIEKEGDAGLYLRGSPQVQIWDISLTRVGAQVGSGGLYNNQINPKNPLKVADNPVGEWNTFRVVMRGERVTVYLNGELVVDNVILENYWDRNIPIFIKDAIELQAHGNHIVYRNIYVKELVPQPTYKPEEIGFEPLFDGSSLFPWTGNTTDYVPVNGELVVDPKRGGKGNLYTKKEYGDFHMKFEFQLTPGANNGLGIRTPIDGDAAYVGMELQILDNTSPMYAKLQPYQYHGSVYGIIPAKQGFLKPVGEWNEEEVIAEGNHIKVILNGEVITDGDIVQAIKHGTPDHKEHPGLLNKTGHIGFLGHGSPLKFRNLRIKEITKKKK
ncbi:3-keto-disaccharide hydrolase [Aquirufa regiilacus]